MIEVNKLKYMYNKANGYVLDDISFVIPEDSINIFLGLNGCGKTTLLKLIAGLLNPISGIVQIDKKNIKEMNQLELAKKLSYVYQRQNITNDFTVLNYLLTGYASFLRFYESVSDTQRNDAIKIAHDFKIDMLLERQLDQLSGGQLQLVSICKSLIQNSGIILLDEPTSALDLKNQYLVLNMLKKIASKKNKTIILTTHNPNHALFLDANVFCMKKGKLIGEGKSEKIIKPDFLSKIYGKNLCFSSDLDYNEVSFNA